MPAMPRLPTKAKKIAYKIMGVPANISFKPNAYQRWINKRLVWEETIKVR